MKQVQELLEKGVEGCESCKVGSTVFQQASCPGKRFKNWLLDLVESRMEKRRQNPVAGDAGKGQ